MSRLRPWRGVAAPAPPKHYRRLAVLTGLVLLALGAMVVQLVNLQVFKAEALSARSERIRTVREDLLPQRGQILDRNRLTLAQSVIVKEVKADPSRIGPRYARFVAEHVAGPLDMEVKDLTERLARDFERNSRGEIVKTNRYAFLRKGVTQERWTALQEALRGMELGESDERLPPAERKIRSGLKRQLITAFAAERNEDQVRVYPEGRLASHVLGFVGYNPRFDAGEMQERTTGVEGLERTLNTVLRGVPGWRIERRISRAGGTFWECEEEVSPRAGLNVVLTLDARMQRLVEEELAKAAEQCRPAGISCVVLRPQTGEILALANWPDFDPNNLQGSQADWRRNRAITDPHEPGSTFKVISVGAALDAGVVSLETMVDCENGRYYDGEARLWIRDDHPYGLLSVTEVVAKSSNIGVVKIARRLGAERLYEEISRFGIGSPIRLPLQGMASGTLLPLSQWRKWGITKVPEGYAVSATALQMTLAVAAMANEGRLMHPLLVQQVEDAAGNPVARFGPQVRTQAVSAATARLMTRALKSVVEEGTGTPARLEDYSVAGKTGTAQKTINGLPSSAHHFGSFIGFFPADDPQLCIGVFVDDPSQGSHYGGVAAAPVFRAIALRSASLLGLPPETPGAVAEVARR